MDKPDLLSRLILACLLTWCQPVFAHGGVALEDDKCIISIGFLKAHFTVYQPQIEGAREFCEDIPEVARSVFVIEFLHDFLKEMQVDFRIIRDVNNLGVYARWDDIADLRNLEQDTVFYQRPAKRPEGVLTVEYDFEQAGGYIGIVTAEHPTKRKTYHAVFYFQVGSTGYGYLPLFIFLAVLAQASYWIINKFFRRRTTRS